MRQGLFVCLSILSISGLGQDNSVGVPYSQLLTVEIVGNAEHFRVSQEITDRELPREPLQYYWDLPSWSNSESLFSKQLIQEQEIDLHFADKSLKGSYDPDGMEQILTVDTISNPDNPNIYSRYMALRYSFAPPSREFNGEGRDKYMFAMNRPFIRVYDSISQDHEHHAHGYTTDSPFRTSLEIHNPNELSIIVPDFPGIQKKSIIPSEQLTRSPFFMVLSNSYEFETHGSDSSSIHWIYTSEFPPISIDRTNDRLRSYIEEMYGDIWPETLNIVLLNNLGALRSRPGLLVVESSENIAILESRIIEAFIQSLYSHQFYINGIKDPWLVDGIAHYHRYDYLKDEFPEEKLFGKFANNFAARFLDVDELSPTYFHQWLYLFMARQGLDQPISDSIQDFALLNIEAVVKGKTALALSTLRGYAGEQAFKRGLRRFAELHMGSPTTKEDFLSSIQYFSNKDLSWFYQDLYSTTKTVDYSLNDIDQCSYVVVSRISNSGELAIPFSTIGYDDEGRPVLEEWHDGHLEEKDLQLHLEHYSKVEIDPNQLLPDLNGRNHMRKPSGIFQRIEPLRLQFYTGLDQPSKTQIYWMPSVKFNAYDGILAGVNFYNITILPKRWEYKIGPEYSTRTGQLTGSASVRYNKPFSSGWLHAMSFGLYGRYFHYDENLAYARISPGLNLNIRKSSPRSTVQHSIRIRGVGVDRELRPEDEVKPIEVTNANYWVTDLRYVREEQNILHPSLLEFDIQYAARFSRFSLSYRQRYMLPNRQWLGIRGFVGAFIHNQQPEGQPFFSFGLSGTQDYLFDYSFIGRSDSSGIWSQQFFVSDGGFKSATGVYSSNWMTSLSLNVPIWKGIGVFGDLGYSGTQNRTYWDYGIRLAIVPDFLEIYFPIQSNLTTQINAPNYASQIRFILNINQGDIIQRLRRGWY